MKKPISIIGIWFVFVIILFASIAIYIATKIDVFLYVAVLIFLILAIAVNYMFFFWRPSPTHDAQKSDLDRSEMKSLADAIKRFMAYIIMSFALIFITLLIWNVFIKNVSVSPMLLFEYVQSSAIYAVPLALLIFFASLSRSR